MPDLQVYDGNEACVCIGIFLCVLLTGDQSHIATPTSRCR